MVAFCEVYGIFWHCGMLCYRAEEAVPIEKKHIPIFSEKAKIYPVDTLEGIICTHEVNT